MVGDRRFRFSLLALAGGAAVTVFAIAEGVFPYHTSNHDEAVYLQQAAMLLEGRLFLQPPVTEAFRPWFFVVADEGMYPKYSPVPAAMFAAGKVLGEYRVALSLIAAACVALMVRVGTEAFDRRTGLLAGVLLLASPLFLVDASVFLPYVPTTTLNLAFAAAYLHADRTGSLRTAALGGLAVGLAFFARPYTALLFATPFVVHALWSLRSADRSVLLRQGTTAVLGLALVGVTLGYNALVTGDPLLFPYEAFAPRDGLGFGRREILGYEQNYTPALAVRVNAELLWVFATRWVAAGVLGTITAILGFAVAYRRGLDDRQTALGGIALSVPLGNLYFWGNRNVLGELDVAGDGLVSFLGPYYHVDLLVPVALFGAVGLRYAWTVLRAAEPMDVERRRGPALALLVIGALVFGTAGVGMAAVPLADNAEVTDRYDAAYEPFEDREFDEALVFLPTPYGDWLNHPFQTLRNDPTYDGDVVYALDERQFTVVDAFPNRTLYRYAYNGPWSPTTGATVEPRLQPVEHAAGDRVEQNVEAGIPAGAALVSVQVSAGDARSSTTIEPDGNLTLHTVVDGDVARVDGDELDDSLTIPVSGRETVETIIFVDYGTGSGFSYRLEQPVDTRNETVRALTPGLEVCQGASRCGGEAAYVPGTHQEGVALDVSISATSDETMQEASTET